MMVVVLLGELNKMTRQSNPTMLACDEMRQMMLNESRCSFWYLLSNYKMGSDVKKQEMTIPTPVT